MSVKKSVTIKTAFQISFASIAIFCILVLSFLLVFRQIRQFLNNRDYQQCLNEQKEADKVALTYFPIIRHVSWDKSGNITIRGTLNNTNVKTLDIVILDGPGIQSVSSNNCRSKTVKYDNNSGDFFISIKPNSRELSYDCSENAYYELEIIPKDISIVCNGVSKNASSTSNVKGNCSLNNLIVYVNQNVTTSNGWCLMASGFIDLGLGSVPVSQLTEAELQTLGLSRTNVCNNSTGIDDRKSKCVNKNSTPNLPVLNW